MNQYQACLYSFECISHGYSKDVHEIPKCWHFWKYCELLGAQMSSAHACRVVSVNYFAVYLVHTFDGYFMWLVKIFHVIEIIALKQKMTLTHCLHCRQEWADDNTNGHKMFKNLKILEFGDYIIWNHHENALK